jgi:hypothetical protein
MNREKMAAKISGLKRVSEFDQMKPFADLTGKQFGMLRVLGYAGKDKHRKARWWVYCEGCTQVKFVRGANLLSGRIKSCGCLRRYRAHVRMKYIAEMNAALVRFLGGPLPPGLHLQKK